MQASEESKRAHLGRWMVAVLAGALSPCWIISCGSPQEAVRRELPVDVDASKVTAVTSDLGYEVQLTEARVMARDFTFAIAGEAHASSLLRLSYDWLVPQALAHPGHYQGGDITGEMPGRFLLDWLPGDEPVLGEASLLVGSYTSANFFFSRAKAGDLTEQDDPLLGHTAILRGEATKDGESVRFVALIDSPEDRQLVGIPFELELQETSDLRIGVRLETLDALQGDTLFDGLDFHELARDTDGVIQLTSAAATEELAAAYNLLRRTLQTHDHFELTALPQK